MEIFSLNLYFKVLLQQRALQCRYNRCDKLPWTIFHFPFLWHLCYFWINWSWLIFTAGQEACLYQVLLYILYADGGSLFVFVLECRLHLQCGASLVSLHFSAPMLTNPGNDRFQSESNRFLILSSKVLKIDWLVGIIWKGTSGCYLPRELYFLAWEKWYLTT